MEIFRTLVPVQPSSVKIDYRTRCMFLGSCFSENIGNKLVDRKFLNDNNPFGIVYNPLSIAAQLERLVSGEEYVSDDLFQREGIWSSFDHHSRFSDVDKISCLELINTRIKESRRNLKDADILFFTFGTSYVYYLKASGKLVSNCHKVPEREFNRTMASVEAIISTYNKLISNLLNYNPKLHIVFTVSPVRHWKDGVHENQVSKAILLLSIHELCKQFSNTSYFPAYELVMDDLRDYRFYAEDMLHPNDQAINYIWQRFKDCYMSQETMVLMKEVEKITQAYHHRPFNPMSESFASFARQTYLKIQNLKESHQIAFNDEEAYFKLYLNN
jgi:GSCFA family.